MQAEPRRRKHILFVGHLAGAQWFGAERSLLDLLAAVDQDRFEVSCVLPEADPGYLEAVAQHTSRIFAMPYRWSSAARPVNERGVERFGALLLREQVDLVHVNTVTLLDPLLAARRCRVPGIVHARELIDQDPQLAATLGGDARAVVRGVREAATFVIANSDVTRRLYQADFRLYNCVDLAHFDLPNRPAGRLKVGLICNNIAKKGIPAFAELARRSQQLRLPLEFLLIGPAAGAIAGLDAPLHATGYIADPAEAVARVNVVVSLSQTPESFGRTIAEALAARRPVIGYARGATRELVRQGECGYVVANDDLDSVLVWLAALAANPGLVSAMGELARAWAGQRFSREHFAAGLNAIYAEVFARSARELAERERSVVDAVLDEHLAVAPVIHQHLPR